MRDGHRNNNENINNNKKDIGDEINDKNDIVIQEIMKIILEF